MAMDTGAIIVSVLSLVGAVAAALFTGYMTYATDERKRRQEIKVQVQKYADPLLIASHELQDRMWELLDGRITRFERKNVNGAENLDLFTCYLFSQFLAWTHILKTKAQFLSFSEDKSTNSLRGILYKISDEFSTSRYDADGWEFRLWPGHQLGISERMVASENENAIDDNVRPMGWYEFKVLFARDEVFQSYFAYMRSSITNILDAKVKKLEVIPDQRLRRLQHLLIDLIAILEATGQARADRPHEKCNSAKECDCASPECNGQELAWRRANRTRNSNQKPTEKVSEAARR